MPGSPRPVRAVLAVMAVVGVVIASVVGLTSVSSLASPVGHPTRSPRATATVTQTVTAYVTAFVTATATATVTKTVTSSPSSTAPTSSAPTSSAPTSAPTSSVPTSAPTSTAGPGLCANATPDAPDGADGAGGCFPGPTTTGPNTPASMLPVYSGPCTITSPNVVIDSQVVNCRTLDVTSKAGGFVLKNSYLNGGIVQSSGSASFTVQDSSIDSSIQYPACSDGSCPAGKYACGDTNNQTSDCGVTGSNFTILRTEIVGSNRAAYCESSCVIQNSYFHGTNLWPDKSNLAHASSVREEQGLTLRHNSLWCSYNGPFVNGEIGCSANLTGYPDFAPIKNNTVDSNLFIASPGSGFCAYGGGTANKPYSGDPSNATNQKFTNNVFQRGGNGKCGDYGPVTDFLSGRTGNVWSGNSYSDGTTVGPS